MPAKLYLGLHGDYHEANEVRRVLKKGCQCRTCAFYARCFEIILAALGFAAILALLSAAANVTLLRR